MPDPNTPLPQWEMFQNLPGLSLEQKQQLWSTATADAQMKAAGVGKFAPTTQAPTAPANMPYHADSGGSIWGQGGDPAVDQTTSVPAPPAPVGVSAVGVSTGAPPEPGAAAARAPGDVIQQALWLKANNPAGLQPEHWEVLRRLSNLRDPNAPPTSDITGVSSTNGSSRRIMTPEYKASLAEENRLVGQSAAITERMGVREGEKQAQDAVDLNQYAGALQKVEAEKASAAEANAAHIEELRAKVDKRNEEYQQAAQNLDPNRLMRSNGWIGALAMAMGAFGSSLTHSPNYAQQIIDNAINRDIDVQNTQLGAKREQITLARQLLEDNRADFRDYNAAKEATKAGMHGIVAAKLEARAAQLKGTQAGDNFAQAALEQRLKQQTRNTNADELEAKVVQSSTTTQRAPQQPVSAVGPDLVGEVIKQAEGQKKVQEAYGGAGAPGGVTEKDREHYNQVLNQIGGFTAALRQGERLKGLNRDTNEFGRNVPFSDADHEWQGAEREFISKKGYAESGAALNSSEVKGQEEEYNKGVYTSHSRNIRVDEALGSVATTIGARIAGLPPALREDAYARLQSAGFSATQIQAIRTMSIPTTGAQRGAGLGGTEVK